MPKDVLAAIAPGGDRTAVVALLAANRAARRGAMRGGGRGTGDRPVVVLAGDRGTPHGMAPHGVGDRDRTCPNLRVRMTGRGHRAPGGVWLGDAGELGVDVEATTDPADRAHREYRGELLASGRAAMHAVPRQYHTSQMVGPASQRVSVETAIERVEASAHEHGLHRGPSVGEAVASVLVRADAGQVRTAVRGVELKDRYGESRAERAEAAAMAEHELAVRALLAAGGAR